ncbi:hypothetical protein [Streptomyces sp. NPDC059349]|uniref:hypothetical protein n=1 Tax=Streptomyces sp. NPDC059349 TaxID=3346808 RepID=UPI0036862605
MSSSTGCAPSPRGCARRARSTGVVTFSPKVLIPVTRLRRDRCHHCAFVQTPAQAARLVAEFDLASAGEHQGSAPAERFVVNGGAGTVGVIASVTRPFCGDCDGMGPTADGQALNCLFVVDESASAACSGVGHRTPRSPTTGGLQWGKRAGRSGPAAGVPQRPRCPATGSTTRPSCSPTVR